MSYTSEGTILLSTNSAPEGDDLTTMVRAYVVDSANETLQDIWHCDAGIEAPAGLHARWSVEFGSDYLLGRGELSEDLYSLLSAPQVATP